MNESILCCCRWDSATEEQLLGSQPNEDDDRFDREEKVWPLTLAEKMKMLFEHQYPAAGNIRIQPVWAIGELFEFGGDFNKFVIGHRLQKQEGLIFRHMLRMVLLLGEFDLSVRPIRAKTFGRPKLRLSETESLNRVNALIPAARRGHLNKSPLAKATAASRWHRRSVWSPNLSLERATPHRSPLAEKGAPAKI